MPNRIVTRKDVAQALTDWQAGQISSPEIQSWAEALYANDSVDYEDWEGDEENSITNEILATLDMLDMNLALPEDAPIYLEFIFTPLGEFKKGYERGKIDLVKLITESGVRSSKQILFTLRF